MRRLQTLSIPLLTILLVGTPVFWAFPQDLSLGRSTAIVSAWICCGLLLTSLLLMIREPLLANALGGLERMYRWHHRLGVWAYLSILVHPVALAADSWGTSPVLAWSVLNPLDQDWAVGLGWASLVFMMVGLATSLMSGISYRTWRWLHTLLPAAVVLAAGHLLLLGLDYPLLMVPLLAIIFLLWRLFRSDYGLAARPYAVSKAKHPAPSMVEISLRPLSQPIIAHPGQFVLAGFYDGPKFHGCGEYHPFTVSAIHADGEISLAIKALGDCTTHLQAIEKDVAARIQGPFGTFLENRAARANLWIAGGIGITPFLAVLRGTQLAQPVRLIYLIRSKVDAAYLQELRSLEALQPALRLHVVANTDQLPDLKSLLPGRDELVDVECYLCGPPGLVKDAVTLLLERSVSSDRIHFEHFDFR